MINLIDIKLADSLCSTASACGLPQVSFDNITLGKIISAVYEIIAAVSVLFLVIGATKYTISGGDPAGIKNAKNTVIYSIVGLIISLLAFLAVTYLSSKAGGL
ncbi:MAG: hypothetical protein ACHQUB_01260 [Candidatus Saccharimonadia bacterium]